MVGAVAILVAAGCGGSGDDGPRVTPSATADPEVTGTPGDVVTPDDTGSATDESSQTDASQTDAPRTESGEAAAPFPLCPEVDANDIQALTDCIHRDLVTFWEAETGQPIERPVVIEPQFPPEPRECYAPQQYKAWYCSDNQTIYLNTSLLELWREHFDAEDVPYSLAATMAHEVAHAAQFALEPELAEQDTRDPAVSQPLELQADCLAGVWAASAIDDGRLDRETLEPVWAQETELLNDEEHEQTHGLPEQRVARLRAGIDGGVDACERDAGSATS